MLLRYTTARQRKLWLVGQEAKTPPSHGGIRGSIPLRAVDYFKIAQPWKTEHIEYICSAFSCRALSESKPKAQVEVSANDTWTLSENKSKTQHVSGNQKIRNKGNYSELHS